VSGLAGSREEEKVSIYNEMEVLGGSTSWKGRGSPPFSFMKRKINKTRGKTNTSSNPWISSRNTAVDPDPRKSFKEDREGWVLTGSREETKKIEVVGEDKQNKGGNNHNVKYANIINNHGGGSVDSDLRKSFSKTREKWTTSSNQWINTKWRTSRQPQARWDRPQSEQITWRRNVDCVRNVVREERKRNMLQVKGLRWKMTGLDSSSSVETMLPCLALLSVTDD
jgi:hypothetical protein